MPKWLSILFDILTLGITAFIRSRRSSLVTTEPCGIRGAVCDTCVHRASCNLLKESINEETQKEV